MTVLFSKTFKRPGKECNRTDLIAYASYEHDRLRFILVPLRGKITLGPRLQNKILGPFRGHFRKVRRAPPSLLYGSPPSPPPPGDEVSRKKLLNTGYKLAATYFTFNNVGKSRIIYWLRVLASSSDWLIIFVAEVMSVVIGQSGYFIFGFIENRSMYAYIQMAGLGRASDLGPSENQARVGQARVFFWTGQS